MRRWSRSIRGRGRCRQAGEGVFSAINSTGTLLPQAAARVEKRFLPWLRPLYRPTCHFFAGGNNPYRYGITRRRYRGRESALRANADFFRRIKLIWAVQICLEKYSAFKSPQITGLFRASRSERGAARDRHETWDGMRWTRGVVARFHARGRTTPIRLR